MQGSAGKAKATQPQQQDHSSSEAESLEGVSDEDAPLPGEIDEDSSSDTVIEEDDEEEDDQGGPYSTQHELTGEH